MWSLGITILEVVTGFPAYLPGKVIKNGKTYRGGLFTVPGRYQTKVLAKLKETIKGAKLEMFLKEHDVIGVTSDEHFIELMQGMLEFDPQL